MEIILKNEAQRIKFVAKKMNIVIHPARMQIIQLLLEHGTLNVTQIYGKLNFIQAETSLHLGLMREYGILIKVRNGKASEYSVNTEALQRILKFANENYSV